jgi:hypothetical protein
MVKSNINSSQPIFVLGFHRGGTTFVQRLLNCHEKVTIWGENGGIISDLRVMSERYAKSPAAKVDVEQYRDFSGLADKFLPWATPFDADQFTSHIASMLESLYRNPTDLSSFWGFKEIRNGTLEDIDFLCHLFPHCRLIMLVRNPKDMLLSQYFARWGGKHFSGSPEKAVRQIITNYVKSVESFLEIAQQKPSLAKILRYETIQSDTVSHDLFGFLGLPETGISQKLLNEVIRARVGSSFRDTGRLIESNENQLICALFDKQIEAVLHDVASMRALDTIQNWYPTLCRDF